MKALKMLKERCVYHEVSMVCQWRFLNSLKKSQNELLDSFKSYSPKKFEDRLIYFSYGSSPLKKDQASICISNKVLVTSGNSSVSYEFMKEFMQKYHPLIQFKISSKYNIIDRSLSFNDVDEEFIKEHFKLLTCNLNSKFKHVRRYKSSCQKIYICYNSSTKKTLVYGKNT